MCCTATEHKDVFGDGFQTTEFPATARFSRRIDPELKGARISVISVIIAFKRVAANLCGTMLPAITS